MDGLSQSQDPAVPRAATPEKDTLSDRVRSAPTSPGVYWMSDRNGRVLYVGKAINLRSRLRSYFAQARSREQKVHRNFRRVRAVQWMLTATESEALALEESLIRQHEPPLNVMLPHYRFLRVTMGEAFPRFQLAREMVPGDGSLYFGPYPDREALETLFTVLLPLFRIRGDSSRCPWDGLLPRPACYRLDFGWCSGPCAGVVDRAQYRGDAEGLCELLAGGQDDFFRRLLSEMETRLAAVGEECLLMDAQASERRLRMKCAAVELRFEEAASLRDELAVMERLHAGARARIRRLEKQRIGLRRLAEAKEVVQPGLPDADVWAVSAEAGVVSLVVLPFREGRAGQPYRASGTAAELAKSLRAYYRKRSTPPPRVVFVSSGSKHRTVDLATLVRNLWPESPVLFESGDDSETWSAAAALAVRNLNI